MVFKTWFVLMVHLPVQNNTTASVYSVMPTMHWTVAASDHAHLGVRENMIWQGQRSLPKKNNVEEGGMKTYKRLRDTKLMLTRAGNSFFKKVATQQFNFEKKLRFLHY